MAEHVYPCIISNQDDIYTVVFPDLNNRSATGDTLYSALKTAYGILLVDLFIRESERKVLPKPSNPKKFKLEKNQCISYVICDTNTLGDLLEYYDDIQSNDLLVYLEDKSKKILEAQSSFIQEETEEIIEPNNQDSNNEQSAPFEYIDDIEVKPIQTVSQIKQKKTVQPKPEEITKETEASSEESFIPSIKIPEPSDIEIPEPPDNIEIPDDVPESPVQKPKRAYQNKYQKRYQKRK